MTRRNCGSRSSRCEEAVISVTDEQEQLEVPIHFDKEGVLAPDGISMNLAVHALWLAGVAPRFSRPPSRDEVSVLDMGTGSGVMAVTALAVCALSGVKRLSLVATDIDSAAITTASDNINRAAELAAKHDLEVNAKVIKADWYKGVTGAFDVILANPPYLTPGASVTFTSASCAPDTAIYDKTGDVYESITRGLPSHLADGGVAVIRTERDEEVRGAVFRNMMSVLETQGDARKLFLSTCAVSDEDRHGLALVAFDGGLPPRERLSLPAFNPPQASIAYPGKMAGGKLREPPETIQYWHALKNL